MEYVNVDKKVVKLWIIRRCLLFVFVLLCYLPFLIAKLTGEDISNAFFVTTTIIWVMLFLLFTFICFVLPSMQYTRYKYKLDGDELWFKNGVIFKNEVVALTCQMQHITVSQGPIESIIKLKTITIHSAGMAFSICGLTPEVATQLENDLKEAIKTSVKNKIEEEEDNE